MAERRSTSSPADCRLLFRLVQHRRRGALTEVGRWDDSCAPHLLVFSWRNVPCHGSAYFSVLGGRRPFFLRSNPYSWGDVAWEPSLREEVIFVWWDVALRARSFWFSFFRLHHQLLGSFGPQPFLCASWAIRPSFTRDCLIDPAYLGRI